MRRLLGLLMSALAALVGFAQTYGLLTNKPSLDLQEFAHSYAIASSIESYGYALPAAIVGIFLLRRHGRFWLWAALVVAVVGLWLFVGREIWVHYIELPSLMSDFVATHPYFSPVPAWVFLPRLTWHILFPIVVVIAGIMCLSKRSGELPSAGPAGSCSP